MEPGLSMVSRISNWRVAEISLPCTSTTRNAISYLERFEPGVDPDNVRFPLIFRASWSPQPGQPPPKVSHEATSDPKLNFLMRRTALATPDA